MSTYTQRVPRAMPLAVRHLVWFGLVCGVAFLVPYLGVSVFDLQHDVFYLVYFAVTLALIGSYVLVEEVEVAAVCPPALALSAGVGVRAAPSASTAQL